MEGPRGAMEARRFPEPEVVGSIPTAGAISATSWRGERVVVRVGFEPTPPKRLRPERSALDRSATSPLTDGADDVHHMHMV